MKTSKHIQTLAAKINTSNWLSDEGLAESLQAIKTALLKGKYYTRVESVAPSGMSRIISIATISNNNLYHVTNNDILKLAGCDKNGRISGCGMDMLFAAQHNLFSELCPNHRYQDSMTRYNDL